MTLKIHLANNVSQSLEELQAEKTTLQELLSTRKKVLSAASCLLCPIGSSCGCCLCDPYQPEKKGDFLCTALNPCLCLYDENQNKRLFLLPPEVQRMEILTQEILNSQKRVSHHSSTNLSATETISHPRESPLFHPRSGELSFSHADRRFSYPPPETIDLSPTAPPQNKTAAQPLQKREKPDKNDPCYSSDDESDPAQTRCATIYPRSLDLKKTDPKSSFPTQATILNLLKSESTLKAASHPLSQGNLKGFQR